MSGTTAQLNYRYRDHVKRYRRRATLVCQDCGGKGGYKEIVCDDGTGPWYDCGWCHGSGYVTPFDRGLWLRLKKQERREEQEGRLL